jgi:polyisoprenoid-binding protein YceI
MPDSARIDPRPKITFLLASLILGLSLLAGCQSAPENQSAALQPSRAGPHEAVAKNTLRYEIVPDLSDIRFLVFRAGPLAKLGHNHVVQAKKISGKIQRAADIRQSSFLIEIPVKDFQVDDEGARRDEGEAFFPQPDAEAIAGTSKNMLGEKVLDAENYPTIEIESVGLNGPSWGMDITAKIRMHGVERQVVMPAAIEASSDKLVVTSFFSIKQTDYGITPMRVLGGGLQVQDEIKVRMRLVARQGDSLR